MALLQLTQDQQFEQMIVSEALRDLGELWKLIPDPTNGAQVKKVVTEYLPILIQTYGEPIAVKAAERFEDIRSLAGVSGRYYALLADAPEQDRINAHARKLLEPIFRGANSNPEEALRNLEGLTSRMVLEQGRKTSTQNTFTKGSKSKGFVRVPTGTDTCSFCIMLASKTFTTEENAKAGTKFHNKCFCKVTPLFDGVEIEGYDQEAFYQQYKASLKK